MNGLKVKGLRLKVFVLAALVLLGEVQTFGQLLSRQLVDTTELSRRFLTNNTLQQMVEFLAFEYPEALTGSADNGTNAGAGAEIFKEKVGTNFVFRTIVTGTPGAVEINQGENTIEINVTASGGEGSGDVQAALNNTFTGKNTFAGGLLRYSAHGVQILNWSTNNAADFSTNADFTVTFSGSPDEHQVFEYGITNTSTAAITVTIPESFSIGEASATTTVEVPGGSYAVLRWRFDGETFLLSVEAMNDETLVSFADHSGYFFQDGATVDGTQATLATIPVATDHSMLVSVDIIGGSKTNTGVYKRSAGFRRTGSGNAAQVSTTQELMTKEDDSAWDVAFSTSGTNVLVRVTGDAIEPVNWAVHGFAFSYTNGLTACSTERDAVEGTASSSFTSAQYYWMATKFTAGASYTTCSGTLQMSKTGTPNGNLTVSIYSHDAILGYPDAEIGSASAAVAATSLGASEGAVLFESLPATLVSGTVYWLVVKGSSSDDVSNHFKWHLINAGGGVKSSAASDNGGSSWTTVDDSSPFLFVLRSN